VRSRAAATILSRAGFKEVHSMEGGIHAWKGAVAKGPPELGIAYFSPGTRPEELLALAWLLEDGSRKFYSEIAEMLADREAVNLFQKLAVDEENHKGSLFKMYQEISGLESDPGFPGSLIATEPGESYMEGGVRLSEALDWAKEKNVRDVFELSISLEVNSQDLYIKMEHRVEDKKAKEVFEVLSQNEKKHLERLNSLFKKSLGEEEEDDDGA
jgi:rubrerythrin